MIILQNKIKNQLKNKQNKRRKLLEILRRINYFKYLNTPYKFYKQDYNPIIPLKIFQTWFTKDLPEHMKRRVELMKKQNPRFRHYLFDDNDCREFIKNNFSEEILNAYDSLIPGAYKADLWRNCTLYVHGGIYLDIKLASVNGFRLIELTDKEHFVKDRPPNSIFNSLMVCQQGNPFLMMAINKIVENVKNKYYGTSALSPTGPEMLGKLLIDTNHKLNIDMIHYDGGGYIIYKNRFVISTEYAEYNTERSKLYNSIKTKRYDALWDERNIYR
jgi:mannosyltransferase OCH1-like enzyme